MARLHLGAAYCVLGLLMVPGIVVHAFHWFGLVFATIAEAFDWCGDRLYALLTIYVGQPLRRTRLMAPLIAKMEAQEELARKSHRDMLVQDYISETQER
jgi:hypothetical protein